MSSMRRFFVDPLSITAETAYLSKTESQHIAAVLRLKSGDTVELFDGTGKVYHGKLQKISSAQVTVQLLSNRLEERNGIPPLILCQGLLKGKKMDFLIQKATELGIQTFQPLVTRYSENRGNPVRQNERWQRIMLEACKQSKRTIPMKIQAVASFDRIDLGPCATRLFLWEDEQHQAIKPTLLKREGAVCLLVGPEGGFHPDEVILAREKGFQTVTLGRRTLRAETASLAAVTIVQYLLEGLTSS